MSDRDLQLSLASGDHALTRAIQTVEVKPGGIDLKVYTPYAPERHWEMLSELKYDICEQSLGSYLASRSCPEEFPFTAIPVFPHRSFRHSYMFKHSGSNIRDPGDLNRQKVGINTWQTTAGVWMRGIAKEEYGLDLRAVKCFRGAPEDVPLNLSSDFNIRKIPKGRSLDEMLASGELEGAFYPALLDSVKNDAGGKRIFAQPFEEERNYYRRTGIFPIMHTVVIREEVLEQEPWVSTKIYELFKKSKNAGLEKLEDPRTSALVWARKYFEEESGFFKDSPWQYGLTEANTRALNKLQEYAREQDIIPSEYDFQTYA